jgi:hypothetical protein
VVESQRAEETQTHSSEEQKQQHEQQLIETKQNDEISRRGHAQNSRSLSSKAQSSPLSHLQSSNTKKSDPFKSAKEQFIARVHEEIKRQREITKKRNLLKQQKKIRHKHTKKALQRSRRGQPLMKNYIDNLLSKIEREIPTTVPVNEGVIQRPTNSNSDVTENNDETE